MTPEYRIIDDNVYVPEHYHIHNSATKGYVKGTYKHLSGLLTRKLRSLSGNFDANLVAAVSKLDDKVDAQYLALSGKVELDIRTAITNLISGAPGALDTLKELSDYVAGEGGLSGLITELEKDTEAAIEKLSGDVDVEFQSLSGLVENYAQTAVKAYNKFSGVIDEQKLNKDFLGDEKLVQDFTYNVDANGAASWTKKTVSPKDGSTEETSGSFDFISEDELKDVATALTNKINEKINIANFGEGSIVSDIRIQKIDQNGNIHIAAKVFNAVKNIPAKTWVQEIVLQDGITAKLSGDNLILGNTIKEQLEDYIAENNLRVSRKVNASQFGNGTVIQNVRLGAAPNNSINVRQDLVNVITGHGDQSYRNQDIDLVDGLTTRQGQGGKLIIGNTLSGALVEHIQNFNDTISNLVGSAPETLDQLHEIAAYISGDPGLSGFITTNLAKINSVSGVVEDILTKTAVVNAQPDDGTVTANKRVLMQSVTFDQFSVDNQKVTGWEVDLDNGNHIPVEVDVSALVSGIASIDRAVVTPRPATDPVTPDQRVLMQSITFDQFSKANKEVTGWMVDLDTGANIGIPINVSNLVKEIAEIDQAKVKPQPAASQLPPGASATANKRVLMQSITFDQFSETNPVITGWEVDLDTGDQIPVEINVSGIVSELLKYKANVLPRATEPQKDRRVLMQSITLDKLASDNEVTAWSVDLDTGAEIPNVVNLTQFNILAKVFPLAANQFNNYLPKAWKDTLENKRALLQYINFGTMIVQQPGDGANRLKNIKFNYINLDTGAIETVDQIYNKEERDKIVKWLDYKYENGAATSEWAQYGDRAVVQPGPDWLPAWASATIGKRTLLQSIDFSNWAAGNITSYMVNLDDGSTIPLTVDVNAIKDAINANKAVVNPRPAGDINENKRVLMQSLTFEKIAQNIISAWSINLDTGAEIKNEFDLTPLNMIAKVNPRPTSEPHVGGKRVLMQSITYDGFDQATKTISITGWMVDLDTGAEIAYPFKFTFKDLLEKANGLMDAIYALAQSGTPDEINLLNTIKGKFKAWINS
jgi:hypothetical protein